MFHGYKRNFARHGSGQLVYGGCEASSYSQEPVASQIIRYNFHVAGLGGLL